MFQIGPLTPHSKLQMKRTREHSLSIYSCHWISVQILCCLGISGGVTAMIKRSFKLKFSCVLLLCLCRDFFSYSHININSQRTTEGPCKMSTGKKTKTKLGHRSHGCVGLRCPLIRGGAQSILEMGRLVPSDVIIFAREVIKRATGRHVAGEKLANITSSSSVISFHRIKCRGLQRVGKRGRQKLEPSDRVSLNLPVVNQKYL